MDDVVSILVVVVAVALTAYRNYIKKEKKRNRTSRGRTAGRAPVRVEAEDTESFVKEEHVAHRAAKEKDRRREGAERRNRKASGKPQEREQWLMSTPFSRSAFSTICAILSSPREPRYSACAPSRAA